MHASDPYIEWDIMRVLVASMAIIGGVALVRFGIIRWRQHRHGTHPDRPHPATFMSYAICLFLLADDRLESIGHPLNAWRLVGAYVVVFLGAWGLGARYMYVRRRHRRR